MDDAIFSEQTTSISSDTIVTEEQFLVAFAKLRRATIIFAEYNQQAAKFLNLFFSLRYSTCFRRFFRPSSGAQNCTYRVRYLSDQYLTLYVQF